jgi:hypothetical protein
MPTVTTPAAPARTPANPNLKKAIGISLNPATDRVIVQWVDFAGKVHTAAPGERKPSRGTIITEIVDRLLAAGWAPGDEIQVSRPKPKRK